MTSANCVGNVPRTPTIKQPFLPLTNMFLCCLACAPPITLIGQRTMKAKEEKKNLCIFQFLRPRGGRSLVIASTGTAAQQDSHMSFPHSHSDRFLLPHRRRIFFNDRSLKALPVNKSPRPQLQPVTTRTFFFFRSRRRSASFPA